MSKAIPLQRQSAARSTKRRKRVAVIAVAAAGALILAYILIAALFPPAVDISPATGSMDVAVDEQLKISVSWMQGSVESVSVRETTLDPLGNPVGDRIIAGSVVDDLFLPDGEGPLLKPDARYEVTVNASVSELTLSGPQRRDVTENVTFQTITTPAPIFLKPEQIVAIGQPIMIEFNTPVKEFKYEINPQLASTSLIDEDNPTRARINFEGYEQGLKYELTVTHAVADNGATLQKPYKQTIATTDPLKVVFVPGDGESAVSRGARPALNFTHPIRNRELAESLLTIEPNTLGAWEWSEDDLTVEFKPLQDWIQGQTITIRLKGGPEAFRSETGGFLREDVFSSFTIKPSKLIDVNLTTQTMTLFDNDQQVKTMLVSSGSQATPSLTGTYSVYHKAEKVDMRGEGYFAPNVPWVLMFNGDYTIHGNYWATTFGAPSSHGCVGLPPADAEYLYNWTPIGTIVNIHN